MDGWGYWTWSTSRRERRWWWVVPRQYRNERWRITGVPTRQLHDKQTRYRFILPSSSISLTRPAEEYVVDGMGLNPITGFIMEHPAGGWDDEMSGREGDLLLSAFYPMRRRNHGLKLKGLRIPLRRCIQSRSVWWCHRSHPFSWS